MSNHHVNATIASEITSTVPFFFQSYGRGRARIEIAILGLLWSFLQNERQRRHEAKLRPGRNIVYGPIVRRGATTSEVVGDNYRLMEEKCDWKTATPSEIYC